MTRSPLQRVVDHRQVARLEDVERQLAARQQQRAGQREDRDHRRAGPAGPDRPRSCPCRLLAALDRPSGEQDRRTASAARAIVISSVGPQASKNWTSCLRAASSFQLRSRRTISRSWSIASSRRPRGVERQREVEARLVVGGIGLEPRARARRDRRATPPARRARSRRGRRRSPGRSPCPRRHGEEALRALEVAEIDDGASPAPRAPRRSPGPAPALRHRARPRRRHRPRPRARRPRPGAPRPRSGPSGPDEALDEPLDLALGQRAHEAVDRLAVA